jgi:cytoskeleton protein RodZ
LEEPAQDLSAVTESESGEMLAEAEMGLRYAEEVPVNEPVVTETPVENSLQLAFDGDCWIEVRDQEGRRLIYELARAGTVRNVEGVPPFLVVLGNARAVQLKYNGEVYNFSRFVRQNVARFELGKSGLPDGV